MEAADDRDGTDVEFANEMGRRLADRLLEPRLGILAFLRPKPRAHEVLRAAIDEATQYHSRRSDSFVERGLPGEAERRYENAVGNAIRTMSLSRRLGGVPVLVPDAGYGDTGLTVVDVFHPPAIRSLMLHKEAARVAAGIEPTMPGPESTEWPTALKRVLPGLGGIAVVDDRTAARGFMTSLLFNLRGVFKARQQQPEAPSCAADYTVNCRDGFVLEWFEEFRYAPTMFGDRKSSPVSDFLECGYYRFQATDDTACIIDSGRHPNTPNRRSTILKDVS
ncbi:MAG: hypothetical protein AB7P34_14820 [Vicinamibacterales bacterium]